MGQITLVELNAKALSQRLYNDLVRLDVDKDVYDESWFSDFMDHLGTFQAFARGFEHARSLALAILSKRWDAIDPAIKKAHGYTFQAFAQNYTGKEWSTIDNWIRIANVWLGQDHIMYPNRVRIVDRLPSGEPKKEGSKVLTKEIEFSPWHVDQSKLLLVNSRASQGTMTDRLWELVADPLATCDDIRVEMSVRDPDPLILRFIIEGPFICVQEGSHIIPLAEVDFEPYYKDDPESLHVRGLKSLLNRLNIILDEEEIIIEERKNNLANREFMD